LALAWLTLTHLLLIGLVLTVGVVATVLLLTLLALLAVVARLALWVASVIGTELVGLLAVLEAALLRGTEGVLSAGRGEALVLRRVWLLVALLRRVASLLLAVAFLGWVASLLLAIALLRIL